MSFFIYFVESSLLFCFKLSITSGTTLAMHTTTILKITIEVCGADLETHFAIAAQSMINYGHSSIAKKKHFSELKSLTDLVISPFPLPNSRSNSGSSNVFWWWVGCFPSNNGSIFLTITPNTIVIQSEEGWGPAVILCVAAFTLLRKHFYLFYSHFKMIKFHLCFIFPSFSLLEAVFSSFPL